MLQYRAASFISIQALYDYKNEPKKEFVPEKQYFNSSIVRL